MGAGTKLR